jgi:hypothetical protein
MRLGRLPPRTGSVPLEFSGIRCSSINATLSINTPTIGTACSILACLQKKRPDTFRTASRLMAGRGLLTGEFKALCEDLERNRSREVRA